MERSHDSGRRSLEVDVVWTRCGRALPGPGIVDDFELMHVNCRLEEDRGRDAAAP